jgi:hypothetical protein
MASLSAVVGFLILFSVHTLIAAVVTRFFRIRMKTTWGSAVYALIFVPMLLLATTLILSGPLSIGSAAFDRTTALVLVVAMPLTLGFAIDLLWMPDPETVELPDKT